MKLIINKDRSVIPVGTSWGTVNENDYEILDFEFPAELEEYNKRIVYYLGDERVWDTIVNNKAYITNAITTKGDVKAYVWCTKENTEREADTDFRTMLFEMHFFENENADGIVPTEEQVDGFNTMLTAMNAKIDEVDALEQTIETAEAQRQEAEATRVSNENTRESNESTRQTNEQTRQTQEADRERRTDEAIADIEDKTAEYNANAEEKTNEFNDLVHAQELAIENYGETQLNAIYRKGQQALGSITTTTQYALQNISLAQQTGVSAVETASSEATTNFNTNATNKTNAFNSNASTKTSEFNSNAESKTSAFNDNTTQKTTNFDNNASEKTDEFNTNAQNKIDEYDEHIADYQAQIDELQEEVEELSENMPWNTTEQATEIQVTDAAKYSRNKLELFGNTSQATRILPDGYTQLDYIESTGTQYINTGVATSNTIKVEAEVINTFGFTRNNKTYGGALFGGRLSSTNSNFSYVTGDAHDYVGIGNNFIEINKNTNTDLLKIQYDVSSINIYCGNYEYINNNLSIDIIDSFNIYIFANNQNNTIGAYGTYKVYKFKIYDNDTLVRDFVPCKNANNEGGLFDLVSQTFFGNAGTGNFVAGNEVSIPNPDYPQDIHVVTGQNTVKVQGKNWFSSELETGDISYQTGNNTSISSRIRTKDFIEVIPNKIYTLKRYSWTGKQLGLRLYDKNKNYLGYYSAKTTETITFTTNEYQTGEGIQSGEVYYIKFIDLENDLSAIYQLEEGSTASTDYVPYYHADYPINLGNIELCKIGDYQDYLYKENGNWYKYEEFQKHEFTTGHSWPSPTGNHYYWRFTPTPTHSIGYMKGYIYNSRVSGFNNMPDYHFGFENSGVFHIKNTNATDAASMRDILVNANEVLYYVKATPTSTQITDETLISQLDAIYEHLQLVKGTNNITVTAEDLAPYMELTYMQDLPSKLDNLDSRLSLLE